MSPLQLLQNPVFMKTMTVSQKLIAGFQVALLGMVIVFFILLLLMLSLNLLKKIFYGVNDNDDRGVDNKIEKGLKNDRETMAVIMAVLFSAYFQSSDRFRVKRIIKVKDNVPIWGRIARGGGNSSHYGIFKGDNNEKISGNF